MIDRIRTSGCGEFAVAHRCFWPERGETTGYVRLPFRVHLTAPSLRCFATAKLSLNVLALDFVPSEWSGPKNTLEQISLKHTVRRSKKPGIPDMVERRFLEPSRLQESPPERRSEADLPQACRRHAYYSGAAWYQTWRHDALAGASWGKPGNTISDHPERKTDTTSTTSSRLIWGRRILYLVGSGVEAEWYWLRTADAFKMAGTVSRCQDRACSVFKTLLGNCFAQRDSSPWLLKTNSTRCGRESYTWLIVILWCAISIYPKRCCGTSFERIAACLALL